MPARDRTADPATQFLRALERGDFGAAAAAVSPEVAADAMSAPRLAQLWVQLVGHLGALEALAPHEPARDGGQVIADFAARFARSEVTLRVLLDEAARVVGFWVTPPRPPAYEPPAYVDAARFREEELSLGADPPLGATLTLPVAGDGWPAAVLVHGSGPNDRDERLGGNRPFRDLAWGLATRGVAVLRYDKRTYAHAAQLAGASVSLDVETVDDALAALAAVRRVDGVDPRRVFVVGHSLGATFAPEIAARDGAIAGVVMLAPSGRPAAEVVADQLDHLASLAAAAGESTAELDAASALVAELAARRLPGDTPVLGAPASYWCDLDDRRPLETGRALAVPVLALFGGRDYQVTAADAALWREALAANPRATVGELPRLDHLFRDGEGTATPADYLTRRGHVAVEVIDLVARWIAEGAPAPETE